MKGKWITLKSIERKRIYIFRDLLGSDNLVFTNVKSIYISENSGTHYLECDQGKCIVFPGWLAIIIDTDEWTHPAHPPENKTENKTLYKSRNPDFIPRPRH